VRPRVQALGNLPQHDTCTRKERDMSCKGHHELVSSWRTLLRSFHYSTTLVTTVYLMSGKHKTFK
jgi:hypothetical protein